MQPNDSHRHAIIGWLTERGHSPEAIKRIMERLGQYGYRDVYRALFEGDRTLGVDVYAIITEVEDEFLAEARQEISGYLGDRGHPPNEVAQIMQRLRVLTRPCFGDNRPNRRKKAVPEEDNKKRNNYSAAVQVHLQTPSFTAGTAGRSINRASPFS